MESSTTVSRYVSQSSKKRVFLAESSSSGCKEVEVLEISSPNTKQKGVIYHEIIDVDMDEDNDFELMLTDKPEIATTAKGKKVLSNSSGDPNSLAYEESGSDGLNELENIDDFGSNQYYEEDDWVDTYYDDIIYDDSAALQSQFDHMDIPTGVEISFPWLSSSPKNNTKVTSSASTSKVTSTKFQSDKINPSHGSNSSDPFIETNAGNQILKRNLPSIWTEPGLGKKKSPISTNPLFHKIGKEPSHFFGKSSNRKPRASKSLYSSHYSTLSSVPFYSSTVGGGYPILGMPQKGRGLGSSMPAWQDLPMNAFEPSFSPSGLMNGSTFTGLEQDSAARNLIGASPVVNTSQPAKVDRRNSDDALFNFSNFKRFDTVEDSSDHHFSKSGSSAKQPPKNWAKKIQEEWKILKKDLPDKIFVRVYESRMDLLRAVIIGAEGTPYHDGLFFFDVFFPSSYPNVPPHVYYHSRGLRINPNLYNCGKVCLSLLNTWGGGQKEKWIPGTSTMLQVLVSIQGLILNAKPFFNEPGYAKMSRSADGEKRSSEYNERTFIYNLQTMVYNMRRPPMNFEDFAVGYFCKHARGILVSCKAYLDGAQVGCLVKGGVQDVDEGDKSCSKDFKSSLALFMTTLINQFTQIGAKDCQEFLYLAQLENGITNAALSIDPHNLNLLYSK